MSITETWFSFFCTLHYNVESIICIFTKWLIIENSASHQQSDILYTNNVYGNSKTVYQ